MIRTVLPMLPLLLAVSASPAFGWNAVGHMAVAAIAYDRLTPAAKARVKELLKLNPDYASWIAEAGGNDPDKVAFMRAAHWPDDIKFSAAYDKEDEQWFPDADKITGYSDMARHKYWHYKDIPFSIQGALVPAQAKKPNAQTQIAEMRKLLGSDASDDVKSYSLSWLNHLVGDVHQPLHAAARFSPAHKKGDVGGNSVAICASFCTNLHSFWDGAVGAAKTTKASILMALNLQERLKKHPPNAGQAAKSDENVWISESSALARKFAYASPVGTGTDSSTLDATYVANAGSIAEKQVALAGVRLANLINASLK